MDLEDVPEAVDSANEYFEWRSRFAPYKVLNRLRGPRKHRERSKRNYHEFKRSPPKPKDKDKVGKDAI